MPTPESWGHPPDVDIGADVRGRVERICLSDADARTLRLRLLAAIGRAVPFDAYAWVLTDPETSVGSSPLAAVPGLDAVPRLIRLRYLTVVNRWTALVDPAVATLSVATGGDLSRSLLWRDHLCRYDVSDVPSIAFRDPFGCWAFLELWRIGGRVFAPADVAVLEEVVAPVTAALRRAQAATFAATPLGHPPSGPSVLLLSPELEVVRRTPGTHEQLRLLVPRDDAGPPVPAGAYNVAAQLLSVEAGLDPSPPMARVHLADGLWVTLRAARLDGGTGETSPDIAVTIEESTPAERLEVLARSAGLSAREHEVLGHVAAGLDTRETASRMNLSTYTVQDHLKSVFAKTGTRSRRSLVARARGGRPPS